MSSAKGIAEFSKTGIRWTRNDFEADRLPREDEVCIRWGCTSNVASKNVLNTAKAIHVVNDKPGFRKALEGMQLAPETWYNPDDVPPNVLGNQGVIVRPAKHAQGRNIFYCNTWQELQDAWRKCAGGYISEFIMKEREFRVYVVQGRAVAVAEKIPEDKKAVAWNHARGSTFVNVRWDAWPLQAVRKSIEAFNVSGLDFGGVDVMVDEEGKAFIIEINSAPSLTSEYRQQCMAKAFDYIAEHGKDKIPLVKEKGGYLKFIHPAINDRARIGRG
jgi:glutathione synthase/RimK-type ligase-like ATP-grasp enzyme